MEAGLGERALDERVAESIFGWKWVTNPAYRGRWLLPPQMATDGAYQGLFEIAMAARHMQKPVISNPEGEPKLPHFSANLQEAWSLVEYIANTPNLLDEDGLPAQSRFVTLLEKASLWNCSAKEAAKAICTAALKVLGE